MCSLFRGRPLARNPAVADCPAADNCWPLVDAADARRWNGVCGPPIGVADPAASSSSASEAGLTSGTLLAISRRNLNSSEARIDVFLRAIIESEKTTGYWTPIDGQRRDSTHMWFGVNVRAFRLRVMSDDERSSDWTKISSALAVDRNKQCLSWTVIGTNYGHWGQVETNRQVFRSDRCCGRIERHGFHRK